MPTKDPNAAIDAVAELSVVTDQTLQDCIAEWQDKGFRLQSIDYILSEASKRPQMAFLFFTEIIESEGDIQ